MGVITLKHIVKSPDFTVYLLWQTDDKLCNAPHRSLVFNYITPLYFKPMFKQINRSS